MATVLPYPLRHLPPPVRQVAAKPALLALRHLVELPHPVFAIEGAPGLRGPQLGILASVAPDNDVAAEAVGNGCFAAHGV